MRTSVWVSGVLLASGVGLGAYWFTHKGSGDGGASGASPAEQGSSAARSDRSAQDKLDPATADARNTVDAHGTGTHKDEALRVDPYPLPSSEELAPTPPPYVGLAFKADPTLGGADAFAAKHRGATAHDRSLRLLAINAVIEQYVDGDPSDPTEAELYGALKDEAIWLKEHPDP